MTTIRLSAGSWPSGSRSVITVWSAVRRRSAEKRMGLLVLYMKSHTWNFVRSAGSFWISLTMSAHRAGLEAVPWTRTTGIRPRRYGCIMMRPSPKMLRPARRKPASSESQTGAPSSPSASAALGSSSSGNTTPSASMLVASSSAWSSRTPRNRPSERLSMMRSKRTNAVTGTLTLGGMRLRARSASGPSTGVTSAASGRPMPGWRNRLRKPRTW